MADLAFHLETLETSGLIRLVQAQPELEYLFRHGLVQDATYRSLLIADRQRLHQCIGETLEQLYPDKLEQFASALSQHFVKAGEFNKAIRYLRLAGDNARQAYANKEAIHYYQQALTILKDESLAIDSQVQQDLFFYLYEHLGDVLSLIRQSDEAGDIYQLALNHVPQTDSINRARLQRKWGDMLDSLTRFQEKFRAYDAAENTLGSNPTEPIQSWWQEWINLQMSRSHNYYYLGQADEMLSLAEQIHPILAEYGNSKQKVALSGLLSSAIVRRNRYADLDEALDYSLTGLSVAIDSGDRALMADQHFRVGMTQLLQGKFDEAEKHLHLSLEITEQIGSLSLTSLTYLCVLYRRQHQTNEMQHWCEHSLKLAIKMNNPVYMGMGHANQAWLAWQEQKWSEVKRLGQSALGFWALTTETTYPFQWAALWPLLVVALREGDVATAVAYAQQLLHPSQQRLPDPITILLKQAITSWRTADPRTTSKHLQQAVAITQEMGLF